LPGLRCLPSSLGLLPLCFPAAAPPLLCSPVPAEDSSSLIAALLRLLCRSWTYTSHGSSSSSSSTRQKMGNNMAAMAHQQAASRQHDI
jgi:hypothetical protein